MTQIFDADGKVIPVTVVEAGPCTVVQKKTVENDGYEAVQMGYQPVAERKLNKPELGHLAKAGVEPMKVLKEFRLNDCSTVNVGDVIKADIFAEGEHVDCTGISKGKGYAGVIKRYGAQRTPMTHGGGPVLPRFCPRRRATAPASATTRRRLLPASIRRRLPPEITKERRVS